LPGDKTEVFWAGRRLCCGFCGGWFTAQSGTVLDRMHLGYRDVVFLYWARDAGWSAAEIGRAIGRDPDTVRRYLRRLFG